MSTDTHDNDAEIQALRAALAKAQEDLGQREAMRAHANATARKFLANLHEAYDVMGGLQSANHRLRAVLDDARQKPCDRP